MRQPIGRPDLRNDADPDEADALPPLPRTARPPRRRVSLAEYLAFEERHPARHELVDGYIYAMPGASLPHNRIVGNIAYRLMTMAGDGPCHVYVEAAKVHVSDENVYYPDVMVVCDPAGEDEDMAYAPCLLVEVLSPSTMRMDRSQKLTRYQSLPSLRAYLIVSRRERHVLRHWREAAGAPWQRAEYAGGGEVPVPCPVAGVLTLDQIYRTITFGPRLRRVREAPAAGVPAAGAATRA